MPLRPPASIPCGGSGGRLRRGHCRFPPPRCTLPRAAWRQQAFHRSRAIAGPLEPSPNRGRPKKPAGWRLGISRRRMSAIPSCTVFSQTSAARKAAPAPPPKRRRRDDTRPFLRSFKGCYRPGLAENRPKGGHGRAFQFANGRLFQSEAGRDSDLKPATQHSPAARRCGIGASASTPTLPRRVVGVDADAPKPGSLVAAPHTMLTLDAHSVGGSRRHIDA